jgi:hypothetical protein
LQAGFLNSSAIPSALASRYWKDRNGWSEKSLISVSANNSVSGAISTMGYANIWQPFFLLWIEMKAVWSRR